MNAGMKIDGIEKKSNVGYIFSAIVRGGDVGFFCNNRILHTP